MSLQNAPKQYDYPQQSRKRKKANEEREGSTEITVPFVDEEVERLKTAWRSAIPAKLFSSCGRGSGIGKFSIFHELSSRKDELKDNRLSDKYNVSTSRTMNALTELHDRVSGSVSDGVTWGEANGDVDPRRRRYAFLPGQRQKLVNSGIKIQAEGSIDNEEHKFAMSSQASIDIEWESGNSSTAKIVRQYEHEKHQENGQGRMVCTQEMYRALTEVTNHIQEFLSKKYKEYVTMDNLVAVQPNHHNGALFLPAHLDFPRADGFGVVIATICIRKTNGSRVILIDDGDDGEEEMYWSLNLEDGYCYFLSGNSRNKCLHGILSETSGYRETLNLRYGLHSIEMAKEEIDRHWPS